MVPQHPPRRAVDSRAESRPSTACLCVCGGVVVAMRMCLSLSSPSTWILVLRPLYAAVEVVPHHQRSRGVWGAVCEVTVTENKSCARVSMRVCYRSPGCPGKSRLSVCHFMAAPTRGMAPVTRPYLGMSVRMSACKCECACVCCLCATRLLCAAHWTRFFGAKPLVDAGSVEEVAFAPKGSCVWVRSGWGALPHLHAHTHKPTPCQSDGGVLSIELAKAHHAMRLRASVSE